MKTTYFLSLIFSIFLLNSCASIYVPNAVNTPLFTKKQQAIINLNTGTNGWDLQAAYAVTNHIGIMANTSGSPKTSENGNFHWHKFAEGGLGFFTEYKENRIFELYAGGGYGHIETNSNVIFNNKNKLDRASAEGTRYFIQPSFGMKTEKMMFSFSLRGVYTELTNVKYNNSVNLTKRFGTFIEPVFTFRTGKKRVTLHSQIGGSIPFNLAKNNVRYRALILNLGISIRLGK